MLKRSTAAVVISALLVAGHSALVARLSAQAGAKSGPQTAAEWLAEGSKWYELHSYEYAATAYANALRLNRNDAGALLRLAVSWNETGLFSDALVAADAAIALNPALGEAHNERAYAQESLGDAQPKGSPAEKQRYDAAIASYREAIRLRPTLGLAHRGLGDTYFMLGAAADAIKAYTEAIKFIPDDDGLRYTVGAVLSTVNRNKEAAEQLAEAVRLDGDHYEARGGLATVYGRLGRFPEALEQLRLAMRTKPDYAGGHARLALIHASQGNRAAALDEYRTAEALDKGEIEGVAALLAKSGVIVQPLTSASRSPQRGVCPTVRAVGEESVRNGRSTTFNAEVRGGDPQATLTYNWSVSAGLISSGQGTSSITVSTSGVVSGSVTASVVAGGLPKECDPHSAVRTKVLVRDVPY